jgi:hypothetical protein
MNEKNGGAPVLFLPRPEEVLFPAWIDLIQGNGKAHRCLMRIAAVLDQDSKGLPTAIAGSRHRVPACQLANQGVSAFAVIAALEE